VLTCLALLRDGRLELAGRGRDHEHGHVGLRGAGDHVLDKVAVAGGIDDREDRLGGLELPQRNVDRDATLALGLELVQHPCVLERALAHLVRLLLELLDGTLVDAAALVCSGSSSNEPGELWKASRARSATREEKNAQIKWPVVVDFPESTWPMTTRLMCCFSCSPSERSQKTKGLS